MRLLSETDRHPKMSKNGKVLVGLLVKGKQAREDTSGFVVRMQ